MGSQPGATQCGQGLHNGSMQGLHFVQPAGATHCTVQLYGMYTVLVQQQLYTANAWTVPVQPVGAGAQQGDAVRAWLHAMAGTVGTPQQATRSVQCGCRGCRT